MVPVEAPARRRKPDARGRYAAVLRSGITQRVLHLWSEVNWQPGKGDGDGDVGLRGWRDERTLLYRPPIF